MPENAVRNVLPVGRDAAGREGVIRAQIAVDHPPPLTQVGVQVWKQGGRRRSDKGVTQGGVGGATMAAA